MGLLDRFKNGGHLAKVASFKNGGYLAKVVTFKNGGYLAKTVLVLLSFACVFIWIAFTGTSWVHIGTGRHHGLWVACYYGDLRGITECQREYGGPYWDRWSVVQASGTFAFLGINAALVLTTLYTFVGRMKYNKDVAAITGAVCIMTGFLNLCGMLVVMMDFTAQHVRDFNTHPVWVKPKPGYCFYLSWVALVLEVLSGMLMVKDAAARRKRELKLHRFHWTELYLS